VHTPVQHCEPLLQELPVSLQQVPQSKTHVEQVSPLLQLKSPQNCAGAQKPARQLSLEQALCVEQGDPLPRDRDATQNPKLQALLAQSLLLRHTEPFEHLPQSRLHSNPALASPHFSRPSQNPSPQLSMQKPAVQSPLRQAASVVHNEPAARPPPMQKPKLQTPLEQAALMAQVLPFPRDRTKQVPKLQIPGLGQSLPLTHKSGVHTPWKLQ